MLINVILPQNDLKYHLISFCGLYQGSIKAVSATVSKTVS
nr:MAG TPA_asm: hypothetical protein [Caudoviricetes sp.]